jgi:hypothetical protein
MFVIPVLQFEQAQFVQVVIWLLQHRMLYQVHSYITLLPPRDSVNDFKYLDELSETSSTADIASLTGDMSVSFGKWKIKLTSFSFLTLY